MRLPNVSFTAMLSIVALTATGLWGFEQLAVEEPLQRPEVTQAGADGKGFDPFAFADKKDREHDGDAHDRRRERGDRARHQRGWGDRGHHRFAGIGPHRGRGERDWGRGRGDYQGWDHHGWGRGGHRGGWGHHAWARGGGKGWGRGGFGHHRFGRSGMWNGARKGRGDRDFARGRWGDYRGGRFAQHGWGRDGRRGADRHHPWGRGRGMNRGGGRMDAMARGRGRFGMQSGSRGMAARPQFGHHLMMLASIDTNKDKQFSKEEMIALFDKIDADANGQITMDEGKKFHQTQRAELAKTMRETFSPDGVFKRLDKNGDGKLSKDDEIKFWDRLSKADSDGDGSVSKEEFDAGMKKLRGAIQERRGRKNDDEKKEDKKPKEEMPVEDEAATAATEQSVDGGAIVRPVAELGEEADEAVEAEIPVDTSAATPVE